MSGTTSDKNESQKKCQHRSYSRMIKNASTSSVDKSVHEERFNRFLGYQAATPYLIAYFVGIELKHLVTTIGGMELFLSFLKHTISD